MDLADVAALRSTEGRALLAVLGEYDDHGALAAGERLRREHPAHVVAAAMTQSRLRQRARAKFGPTADHLLLTAAGLEQATRAVVAARHADRFTEAGVRHVVDLCCGIGGDLLAMARAGLAVTGVDTDPVACAVAAANAEALGLSERVDVVCADATDVDVAAYDGVFCDPARRVAGGRRTLSPRSWSPPWPFVAELLARRPAVGVKVAPGIAHHLVPGGVEAEWVSVDGDVVEAVLWGGRVGSGVRRRATLLSYRTPVLATVSGSGAEVRQPVRPVRRFLHEPDGAVIRAGLVAALGEELQASLLDPTIAYLATDEPVVSPLVRSYQVEHDQPFQLKRLRATLRERDIGWVEVKKRGSPIEPEQLRRQLRLSGSGRATVVLTRVGGRPWVLLVRPLGQTG